MLVRDARVVLVLLSLIWLTATRCSPRTRLAADLVVTGANIWTGNAAQPTASAVAVIGDRIVGVGTDIEIDAWRGANTTLLSAEGRTVVPGFNDAHVRFVDGGRRLEEVDLNDATTPAEFARRINERSKAKPGEWILGGRWDNRRWVPDALPARWPIDDVTNSSPVFVTRSDGQMALANAAALGRAGITERTPNPPGGVIVRDERGFPTGILQGTAMDFVTRVIPVVTPEQRTRFVRRALEHAGSLGITSVQDVGAAYEDVAIYADLASRNELTVAVYAILPEAGWYDQAKLGLHRGFGSASLRLGAVRALSDPGDRSADAQTRLIAADHAGLQLSVAIAPDAAAAPALDMLDVVARANGGRDRRFRVEATHFDAADEARFATFNAVVVLRPGATALSASSLTDKRHHTALGSGWPSKPLNPMQTIAAAIAAGATPAAALAALTSGAAFAEFQDGEKGTIARGRRADMVMLSDDILTASPVRLTQLTALTTIAAGRVVHQRKP